MSAAQTRSRAGAGRAEGVGAGEGQRLTRLAEIPVDEVNRVGEKRAEALAALGIDTVLDLITHYPRRYIDRTRQADVAGMRVGEESLVLATVDRGRGRAGPAKAGRSSSSTSTTAPARCG